MRNHLARLDQGDDHLRIRRIEARSPDRWRSGPIGHALTDPSPGWFDAELTTAFTARTDAGASPSADNDR